MSKFENFLQKIKEDIVIDLKDSQFQSNKYFKILRISNILDNKGTFKKYILNVLSDCLLELEIKNNKINGIFNGILENSEQFKSLDIFFDELKNYLNENFDKEENFDEEKKLDNNNSYISIDAKLISKILKEHADKGNIQNFVDLFCNLEQNNNFLSDLNDLLCRYLNGEDVLEEINEDLIDLAESYYSGEMEKTIKEDLREFFHIMFSECIESFQMGDESENIEIEDHTDYDICENSFKILCFIKSALCCEYTIDLWTKLSASQVKEILYK